MFRGASVRSTCSWIDCAERLALNAATRRKRKRTERKKASWQAGQKAIGLNTRKANECWTLFHHVLDLDAALLDLVEEEVGRNVQFLQDAAAFADRPGGQHLHHD